VIPQPRGFSGRLHGIGSFRRSGWMLRPASAPRGMSRFPLLPPAKYRTRCLLNKLDVLKPSIISVYRYFCSKCSNYNFTLYARVLRNYSTSLLDFIFECPSYRQIRSRRNFSCLFETPRSLETVLEVYTSLICEYISLCLELR
jgi:hypothetical protein